MRAVYLSLGTNLGNKKLNINKAIELLKFHFDSTVYAASLYETKPWGFNTKNTFLNTCVKMNLTEGANEILKKIQLIEDEMGRVRNINESTYISRVIDIDILYIGNEIHTTTQLTVPHPLLYERNFVLIPLLELVPSFNDPILDKTIRKLIDECTDVEYPIKIT